jgi:hypothetical protein
VKVFADTNFYTNLWLEPAHADRANTVYLRRVHPAPVE